MQRCLLQLLSGKTVVYATHHLEFIEAADLVLVSKRDRFNNHFVFCFQFLENYACFLTFLGKFLIFLKNIFDLQSKNLVLCESSIYELYFQKHKTIYKMVIKYGLSFFAIFHGARSTNPATTLYCTPILLLAGNEEWSYCSIRKVCRINIRFQW